MSLMKKIVSAAAAAIVSLGALTAARAEEAEKPKFRLLVSPVPMNEDFMTRRLTFGAGFNGSELIDFTDEDVAHWRETGEFTCTKLDYDFDYDVRADFYVTSDGDNAGYLVPLEGGGYNAYLLHYDRENKKLEIVASVENAAHCCPTLSGYLANFDADETTAWVEVISADGTKKRFEQEYTGEGKKNGISFSVTHSKYPFVQSCKINENKYGIFAVTDELEMKELYSFEMDPEEYLAAYSDPYRMLNTSVDMANDALTWADLSVSGREINVIYSVPEGTYHYIWSSIDKYYPDEDITDENGKPAYVLNAGEVRGGKAAVTYNTGHCALLEVADSIEELVSGEYKAVSGLYQYMKSWDGEIFQVVKPDGKVTFMDNEGNLLADFDDTGDFIGEYAVAVKDGKAFLIDRQMNRVSDTVDADTANYATSNGVFMFNKGDEVYAMTYAENTEEAPAESEPAESIPDESAPESASEASESTPAGTDGQKPANPTTGIDLSLVMFGAAGAAAVIIAAGRKRR